jgi:hypothetical protein
VTNPELERFFDLVCDRIAAHETYAEKLEQAVESGTTLILNYHTHGPDQAYCVSVCIEGKPLIGQELEELAHIRGIGEQREECGPRMAAFAARLVDRYELKQEPLVYLDGAPFAAE